MSAFVIPERAGMPDDDQQRMFADWDKIVEVERLRLERARVKLEREQSRAERKQLARNQAQDTPTAPAPPRSKRPYLPQDKRLREYATARKAMQEYEQAVGVKPVTQLAIYVAAGGPHPRTQDRIMRRFGLSYPRDWPPSTWPVHAPIEPDGQI